MVNLIATGSIIAALNIAAKASVDLPFFFGGDGATLLVPPTLLAESMAALALHQSNVKKEFNIDLRVGSLPVSAVYESGSALSITKVKINALFAIPVVLGNGLQFAERVVKSAYVVLPPPEATNLNLEGMECRWNKIPPPKGTDEVVCLLISARQESAQATVYKAVLDKAEAIYGSHKKRNPISLPGLRINARIQKIRTELRMRQPQFGFLEWFKNWLYVLVAKYWYLSSHTGQKYLNELVQLADIFVMDGRISMVITGNRTQREQLVEFLDEQEKAGQLVYGIHVSRESIISCYVQNRAAHHIHFVDGGDGGYTQAAVLLKEKLKG